MAKPVILDTDIGYDPDDYFALLLLFALPELDLKLITTADEVGGKRAAFMRHILGLLGRDVPLAAGTDLGSVQFSADDIIGETYEEPDRDFLGAMKRVVDGHERVTYIGVGGFSNFSRYLEAYPEDAGAFETFFMGGAVGYERFPGWVEHNVKIDKAAAKRVVESSVDLSLIMAQTSAVPGYRVDDACPIFKRLEENESEAHRLLVRHTRTWNRWKGFWTNMHDPLTVAVAAGRDFARFNSTPLSVSEVGTFSIAGSGKPVRWSDAESKPAEFMRFLEERLFEGAPGAKMR